MDARGNQDKEIFNYKLKLEKYYQAPYVSPFDWWSSYYIPETITIISRSDSPCDVTLRTKESYIVVGDQNNFDVVRKFSELTNDEKKWLGEQ
ncbi:hypothetical protein ANCCAN_18629 [Ancylostoma caninum]|uniref:Uncharacterized protein n=1 Tax=Ancylostoma caninum TaxID=29170 RepID=A0A368FXH5_ANCCA|nr:hypothetical protein ANCCAN_18629 [Ancylostoma caninum]